MGYLWPFIYSKLCCASGNPTWPPERFPSGIEFCIFTFIFHSCNYHMEHFFSCSGQSGSCVLFHFWVTVLLCWHTFRSPSKLVCKLMLLFMCHQKLQVLALRGQASCFPLSLWPRSNHTFKTNVKSRVSDTLSLALTWPHANKDKTWTSLRYEQIPARVAAIQKQEIATSEKGVGQLSFTVAGNAKSFKKTGMVSTKLNMLLPLGGVYPTDLKAYAHTKTLIFIIDLFIIV